MTVFHHEPHDPKSNRVMNPIACVIVALAVIVTISAVLCPKASASPYDSPNLGSFKSGSVHCTLQQGKSAFEGTTATVSGSYAAKRTALMHVYVPTGSSRGSDSPVATLSGSADGRALQVVAGSFVIPAWDGVVGHEPAVTIQLASMAPDQSAVFMTSWPGTTTVQPYLFAMATPATGYCQISDG